jgi:hypothetical protein
LTAEIPDRSTILKLLSRYAPVRLEVGVDHLAIGDRLALRNLIEAASWIDPIYWKQRSEEGWRLKNALSASGAADNAELERALKLNYGPWDSFDNDRPFWGSEPKPPGGNLYPPGLTGDELRAYAQAHPEQRDSLFSRYTLVRRAGARLTAIAYHEAYKEELSHVAEGLTQASEQVTDGRFRAFLRARAGDLLTGSLSASERLWIAAADGPIEIAIGPYEVYDDGLAGIKTSYEATVMVRHPMSARLAQFAAAAPDLERRFPGAVAPAADRRNYSIGVYDVIYTAGMTNMDGKAVAATLPNDEALRSEVGARLLLFRNVISAKFGPILKPLGARVLRDDQLGLVSEDAFLYHTLLHEMAHALAACFVSSGGSINEALGERFSTIEECRADLIGMVFLNFLAQRGLCPPGIDAAAAVTFVVNNVRTLRFGDGDDYGRAAAIILSHLLRAGALKVDGGGNIVVDGAMVQRGIEELAATVQDIATRGDYQAAGHLIEKSGSIPDEIKRLLPRLEGVPVDLEFVFDDFTPPAVTS